MHAVSTIRVDGRDRPVHNSEGRLIHADEAGIVDFWRWFGDSTTVDGEGRPLVLYHGTRRRFDAFGAFHPRGAIGNPKGVYFTTDPLTAAEYAQDCDGATDAHSRVVAAYLRLSGEDDGKRIDSLYRGREYVAFRVDAIAIISSTDLLTNECTAHQPEASDRSLKILADADNEEMAP